MSGKLIYEVNSILDSYLYQLWKNLSKEPVATQRFIIKYLGSKNVKYSFIN